MPIQNPDPSYLEQAAARVRRLYSTPADEISSPRVVALGAIVSRVIIDKKGNIIFAGDDGFFLAAGKTSGGFKVLAADATGYLITQTTTTQTVGTVTLTIPDFANVADTYAFCTLAQEFANKTITGMIVKTGLTASGSASNDFSGSTGAFKTSSGLTTITGGLAGVTAALSGAGAVGLTTLTTKLTTTGASQALSLANGTDGQVKEIIHDVDGGSAILTPTTKTGFTTITFTNAGETATLKYVTTRGWVIMALNGAVAA